MFPYVVADIGGTNARYALVVNKNADGHYVFEQQKTFKTGAFSCFEDCLFAYLACIDIQPNTVCIAIAGPVMGDNAHITCRDWRFSIATLQQRLQLTALLVVNDFTAMAYATLAIDSNDLIKIKTGHAVSSAPRAVIGPGTGFGVTALVPGPFGWQVVGSEGGHVGFAPATLLACEVLQVLIQEYGHVAVETLLSGPGLETLHRVLQLVQGQQVLTMTAQEITQQALQGSDIACKETVLLFCDCLGSVAGDIALTYGATGGVYLAGGILPAIASLLNASGFVRFFLDKGNIEYYLTDIPVQLINTQSPGLIGMAAYVDTYYAVDHKTKPDSIILHG